MGKVFTKFLILVSLTSAIQAVFANEPRATVLSTEAYFFVTSKRPNGQTQYIPIENDSSHVTLGQAFGCMFTFDPTRSPLLLVASLTGPGSLTHFRPKAHDVLFSKDGRTVVSEIEPDGEDGSTGYWYTVDPGDPLGTYTLSCSLNGVSVGTARFYAK